MPQLVTDWHAKEQRIVDRLRKVRVKQDALREEADELQAELELVQELQRQELARGREAMLARHLAVR